MIQPVAHPSELAAYAREMGEALSEITVSAPLQVSDGQRKASKETPEAGSGVVQMPNDVYRSGHTLYTAWKLLRTVGCTTRQTMLLVVTSLFLYQKLYMLQKSVSGPPEVADRWPKRHSRRAVLMKRSWKVRHSTSIHLCCGVARGSLVGD